MVLKLKKSIVQHMRQLNDHFENLIYDFEIILISKSHTTTSRFYFIDLENCIFGISSTLSRPNKTKNQNF